MMTKAEFEQTASRLIQVSLHDQRKVFAQDLRLMAEQAAGRGTLGAGFFHASFLGRNLDEIRGRALQIWSIVHRVVSTAGLPQGPDLGWYLLRIVTDFLNPEVEEIQRSCMRDLTNYGSLTNDRNSFHEARERALQVVQSEIEMFLSSLQPVSVSTVQHIYNAPVGAVQTGPGATATVNQNIGSVQARELHGALEEIRTSVLENSQDEATREELLALIDQAQGELAQQKPRKLTLTGMIMGITTGIQTIPNIGPAYAAFKAAASQIGIPLP